MKQALETPSSHLLTIHEIAGYRLSESLYPSNLRQPRHRHESASFSFVLSGDYVENYERRAEVRTASTVVFHPPQESHSVQYQDESVRILNVQFDFARLSRIREHSAILDAPAACRTQTLVWLGQRLYQEFRRMDALSALAIEGLILEILVEASRSSSGSGSAGNIGRNLPRWLLRTRDYLQRHFAESLTLEEIARISGVHPVYLARKFRENFGCTVGEYVRNLRVEFACRQISASDTPLSDIALSAGFSDQSHLTKTFKNQYGLTPSEYRKIFRNR